MLKKQQRLSRAEFDTAFKAGRRYHSPTLTLIHVPGEAFHGSVVVGKKVAKRAVARNLLRRRIYGALYRLMKSQQRTGTYILIAKPTIMKVSRKELASTVAEVVGRVRD